MLAASVPPKFPLAWGANADPSTIRAIPTTSQIGIQNGAASLNDGFPPLTQLAVGAGGVPPFGQDANGILKQLSQWVQWQNAGGTVLFDAAFAAAVNGYPAGAVLASTTVGAIWYNTVDNNLTDPDGGSPVGWLPVGPKAIQSQVGNFAVSTGSANAYVVAFTPAKTVRQVGFSFRFKANFANTDVPTINYGAGPITVRMRGDITLFPVANLIQAGYVYTAVDDGVKIQLMEVNAQEASGSYPPVIVSVPNDGASHVILPAFGGAGGGSFLVAADDGGGNAWSDFFTAYAFSNTTITPLSNTAGVPGTRAYFCPLSGTGPVTLTRQNGVGAANMDVYTRFTSRS